MTISQFFMLFLFYRMKLKTGTGANHSVLVLNSLVENVIVVGFGTKIVRLCYFYAFSVDPHPTKTLP